MSKVITGYAKNGHEKSRLVFDVGRVHVFENGQHISYITPKAICQGVATFISKWPKLKNSEGVVMSNAIVEVSQSVKDSVATTI